MTVNNIGTLTLLNILNRTTTAQESVMQRMATGSRINRGADDPAGLFALTSIDSELTAVKAGIQNNQRTDAVLGVADGALGEVSSLLEDIQRLANESANDAGLTADEIAANQSQIDDAIASIDRIVANTQFNGKKLLDGSLAINTTVGTAGAITDVKVYSRKSGTDDTALTVALVTAASNAVVTSVMTTSTTGDATFSVQGKLGTAVITALSTENVSSVAAKINAAKAQTGISAVVSGTVLNLYSEDKGADAFVRTKLIQGAGISDLSDTGKDAVVTVNGQTTAVDGDHVAYTGNGISVAFDLGTLTSTVVLTIKGAGDGKSGATFQLGTTADTRATLGLDAVYSAQLGNAVEGYLKSVASGGGNSLLDDPAQAAKIARVASNQVASLRGRIGGFQKFQVRPALNSLNDTRESLEKARGVITDVDYAVESAELNRQNILLQSAMSLLGLANQQSAQVLSLLR
jgi:flagellin